MKLDVFETVLSFPKLKERLKTRPLDVEKSKKMIREMKADFQPSVIKGLKSIIDASFLKLYDGFKFKDGEYSIIYIPKLCSSIICRLYYFL